MEIPAASGTPLRPMGTQATSPISLEDEISPTMSLQPLNQVLSSLQKQKPWQEQHQFQHLLESWSEVVGPVVALQTRPLTLSQRGVLQVATSSSVWAQTLSFERHRILVKLNARLAKPLVDLHFSTRYWQNHLVQKLPRPTPSPEWVRPTTGGFSQAQPAPALVQDPQVAFQRWAHAVERRSRQLPHCPNCNCPTPAAELQRWSVCALCAARRW